jgi:hypothetical protein
VRGPIHLSKGGVVDQLSLHTASEARPGRSDGAVLGQRPTATCSTHLSASALLRASAWWDGNLFAWPRTGPVSSTSGGLNAAGETSPSLVYGAALLMRLGF